jgi:hypothetical protein
MNERRTNSEKSTLIVYGDVILVMAQKNKLKGYNIYFYWNLYNYSILLSLNLFDLFNIIIFIYFYNIICCPHTNNICGEIIPDFIYKICHVYHSSHEAIVWVEMQIPFEDVINFIIWLIKDIFIIIRGLSVLFYLMGSGVFSCLTRILSVRLILVGSCFTKHLSQNWK